MSDSSDSQQSALRVRVRALSAADRSVLAAGVATPGSAMTTAPGSANESLWLQLEQHGWMSKRTDVLELPGGRSFSVTLFSVTAMGLAPLRALLQPVADA